MNTFSWAKKILPTAYDQGIVWALLALDESTWLAGLQNPDLSHPKGCLLHTIDGGDNWSVRIGGTTPRNVTALAAAFDGSYLAAVDSNIQRSTDQGVTWNLWATAPFGVGYQAHRLFPVSSSVVLAATGAGSGNSIYYSSDGGQVWSFKMSGFGAVRKGSFALLSDGSLLFAAGSFYRSTDQGATWSLFSSISLQTAQLVLALDGAQVLGGTFPTPYGSGRYLSADYGATWSLQDDYNNRVYEGVDLGDWLGINGGEVGVDLLLSEDRGTTWITEGVGYDTLGDLARTGPQGDFLLGQGVFIDGTQGYQGAVWRGSRPAQKKSDMKRHPFTGAKAHVYNLGGTIRLQWFEPGSLTPDATVDVLTAQGSLAPALEWEPDGRLRLALSDGTTRKESATPWLAGSWGNWT